MTQGEGFWCNSWVSDNSSTISSINNQYPFHCQRSWNAQCLLAQMFTALFTGAYAAVPSFGSEMITLHARLCGRGGSPGQLRHDVWLWQPQVELVIRISLHRASLKANWNSCAFLSTGSGCCSLIDRVKIILKVRTTFHPVLPFPSRPIFHLSIFPAFLLNSPPPSFIFFYSSVHLDFLISRPLPSSPSPGGWWVGWGGEGGHSGLGRLITCSDMKKLARGFSNESDYSSPAAPVAVGQRGAVGDGTPAGRLNDRWGVGRGGGQLLPPGSHRCRKCYGTGSTNYGSELCQESVTFFFGQYSRGAPPPTREHFKPKGFIFPSDHICKQLLKPDVPRRTLKPQTSSRQRNSPYGRNPRAGGQRVAPERERRRDENHNEVQHMQKNTSADNKSATQKDNNSVFSGFH